MCTHIHMHAYIYIYIHVYIQKIDNGCLIIFYQTSISDSSSLDIILPSPDDSSLEPKRYNVDFLSH